MRFTDVLVGPTVLLSLAGAPAIGAGAERSHATGNFAIELFRSRSQCFEHRLQGR